MVYGDILQNLCIPKKQEKLILLLIHYFLDDQSEPEDQHFVWAYQILIDNQSNEKST